MLDPPGAKHQVLMLAEKEAEREYWVGALLEMHRILKKNNIVDRSVFHCKEVYDSQMPIITKIHCAAVLGSFSDVIANIEIFSPLLSLIFRFLDSERLLVGSEEGLSIVELQKDS